MTNTAARAGSNPPPVPGHQADRRAPGRPRAV